MIFKSVQRDRQDHINGIAITMTLCLPVNGRFFVWQKKHLAKKHSARMHLKSYF